MTKIQEASLAALRKSVLDKLQGSYCQFAAGDVTEVGKLLAGIAADDPAAVLVGSVEGLKPHQPCHAYTHVVAHLIDLVEDAIRGNGTDANPV